MRRDVVSGMLLIVGSVAWVFALAHHPTGHDMLAGADPEGQARLGVLIHAIAIGSAPIVFMGLLGLARRLGRSDLVTAALVSFGFAAVGIMVAAVMSGFVATPLTQRIREADAPARDVYHMLLSYTGLINQGFAKVHVVASSVGMLLWSAAIWRSQRMSRAAGVAGAVIGAGVLFALFSGHLRLGVHGAQLVTFATSGWLIWVGVLLCRRAQPVSDPREGDGAGEVGGGGVMV